MPAIDNVSKRAADFANKALVNDNSVQYVNCFLECVCLYLISLSLFVLAGIFG